MKATSFRCSYPVRDGGIDVNGQTRMTRDFQVHLHGVEGIEIEPGLVTIAMADAASRWMVLITPFGDGLTTIEPRVSQPVPEAKKGKGK